MRISCLVYNWHYSNQWLSFQTNDTTRALLPSLLVLPGHWLGLAAHTFTEICPSSFSISPRRADTREDFPQPTCPTTASSEPWGAITLMLERHRDTSRYYNRHRRNHSRDTDMDITATQNYHITHRHRNITLGLQTQKYHSRWQWVRPYG